METGSLAGMSWPLPMAAGSPGRLQQTGRGGPPARRGEPELRQRLPQEAWGWQPALRKLLPITLLLSKGTELIETELESRKLPARTKGEVVYKPFLFLFCLA